MACELASERLEEAIVEGWNRVDPDDDIGDRIRACRTSISKWRRQTSGNSREKIQRLKDELDLAYSDELVSSEQLGRIRDRLRAAFLEEEQFWKQKSRVLWLQEGDRNTGFFHASTKARRARNRITGIMTESGNWTENDEEVENTAVTYFQSLFTGGAQVDIDDEVFDNVRQGVTEAMNTDLMRDVTAEEVKRAVFSIHAEKAPGPDGMTALFYQKFWHILGEDVVKMVSHFFTSGELDGMLNEVNICLIPKKERPREMKEFRPISLCNVGYKIISKVICQRLKPMLPSLISETQSAFVAGRAITDNILIAQEVFHALNTKEVCKKEFMGIKMDMSKAYDRVEWSFLYALLIRMGFAVAWVDLIMKCVSSVSYSVLINGSPKGRFRPSRGLRQGDPLSPYMFILCTEVLILQLQQSEENRTLNGIKVAYRSPAVSHLLFADDSLFLCRADIQQCTEVLRILNTYGRASGQCINFEKSAITFGKGVPNTLRTVIKTRLGITREGGMDRYLGIPEQLQGSKCQIFSYVKDILNQRINGWNAKFLSTGGKEIMIKSVAQAIPTYVMSCFLLPKRLCNQLTSAVAKFWWTTNGNSGGVHWMSWRNMCISKEDGGLGFKSFNDFNMSLLAKQLWKLHQHPNSLATRVLKGRYFKNSHPFEARKPYRPSFGWRSIWASTDLLKLGTRKIIGTGEQTRVWQDNWIPDKTPRLASGPGEAYYPNLRVSDLRTSRHGEWNIPLLTQMMNPEDISLIKSIRPSQRLVGDNLCWHFTRSGEYTVKSGYQVQNLNKNDEEIQILLQEPSFGILKKFVWQLKAPNKLKHFLWHALSGIVPVSERLTFRHIGRDVSCPRCGREETVNHMLFECPPTLQIWALAGYAWGINRFPTGSLGVNMDFLFWRGRHCQERVSTYPWVAWYIWKARNEKLFRGVDCDLMATKDKALGEAGSWIKAQELLLDQRPTIGSEPHGRVPQNIDQIGGSSCFTDGSWKDGEGTSGVGWVLQDHHGNTELVGLKGFSRSISPLHSELHGLLFAMQYLHDPRHNCRTFYTDCKDLLSMVASPHSWMAFSTELETLRDLQVYYPGFTLRYAARERNEKADLLARSARGRNFELQYISSSLPTWISDTRVFVTE